MTQVVEAGDVGPTTHPVDHGRLLKVRHHFGHSSHRDGGQVDDLFD
jgi:hypothetical protein